MAQEALTSSAVVIQKVMVRPMRILYIRDTVSMAQLPKFLRVAYHEIYEFIGPGQRQPGKIMAFYENIKDPINVQAAIEVNTIPVHLPGRILTRIVNGGEALMGHYKGEYEGLDVANRYMKEWLAKINRDAMGLPFEVYQGDPVTTTDIYQFIR